MKRFDILNPMDLLTQKTENIFIKDSFYQALSPLQQKEIHSIAMQPIEPNPGNPIYFIVFFLELNLSFLSFSELLALKKQFLQQQKPITVASSAAPTVSASTTTTTNNLPTTSSSSSTNNNTTLQQRKGKNLTLTVPPEDSNALPPPPNASSLPVTPSPVSTPSSTLQNSEQVLNSAVSSFQSKLIIGAKPDFISTMENAEDPPVLAGWLKIKEEDTLLGMMNWKTRYFVLLRGFLYIYMDKLDIAPFGRYLKEKIGLAGFRVYAETPEFNNLAAKSNKANINNSGMTSGQLTDIHNNRMMYQNHLNQLNSIHLIRSTAVVKIEVHLSFLSSSFSFVCSRKFLPLL